MADFEPVIPNDAPWDQIGPLPGGGQARVFKVRRKARTSEISNALFALGRNLQLLFARSSERPDLGQVEAILPTIQTLVNPNPAEDLGALKLFQIPTGDSAGAERALKRLEQEIEALTALRNEPGIVKLLDSGLPGHWIVTEYQPGGTLADRTERYRGDALAALQAFRPLVQAVAALHGRAEVVVHRDIKLSNIFVAADGRLVLGDFGIVYVGGGSRATATHGERVGDRDWMPPWANVRQRIEHPDPTLDVFPLGKVLWCMVSGESFLPFWYHRRKEHDLEQRFPDAPEMAVINQLLDGCVVEDQEKCLPSAVDLQKMIDGAVSTLQRKGTILREGKTWLCRVCGKGTYQPRKLNGPVNRLLVLWDKDVLAQNSVEIIRNERSGQTITIRVFGCDNCGHLELFHFPDGMVPAGWRSEL